VLSGALVPCPYCQEPFAFSQPIFRLADDPLNDVAFCGTCGLVYKPAFNTASVPTDGLQYNVRSWSGNIEIHRKRFGLLVRELVDQGVLRHCHRLLDVGAGIGVLREALRAQEIAVERYVAVEPVQEIATHLKTAHPDAVVLRNEFGDIALPAASFDYVFVCGVDYLFRDLRGAFEKIAALLAPDGVVVIQRNVFLDQEGYAGMEIVDAKAMFASNPLMRNWFHTDQYVEFVGQFFDVVHAWATVQTYPRPFAEGEFRSSTLNVVARRRAAARTDGTVVRSYASLTRSRLQELGISH
jgi:SAM-dependent methyltransferase